MRGKTSHHWSTHQTPSLTLPQMKIIPHRMSDRHFHAFHSNLRFRHGVKGQAFSLSATFVGPCHHGMLRCCVSKQRLSLRSRQRILKSYHHSRTWVSPSLLKQVSHGDSIVPPGPMHCVRWLHHAHVPCLISLNHLDRLEDVIVVMVKLRLMLQ